MKIKANTFPEELTVKEMEQFTISKPFYNGDSYQKDYTEAKKYALKVKGEVYTMVSGEGNKTFYLKGNHLVNRFGYAVLGWKE